MGKPRPFNSQQTSKLGNWSNIQNLSFYQAADYDPALNDVEDLANALIRFENGASLFVNMLALHFMPKRMNYTLNYLVKKVRG